MSWLPAIRWGGDSQSDTDDWRDECEGFFVEFEWLGWIVGWRVLRRGRIAICARCNGTGWRPLGADRSATCHCPAGRAEIVRLTAPLGQSTTLDETP